MGLLKQWGSAMYWMRKRASDGEDSGIDESMDLGNGVHLEIVRKFYYLGDMLNGGGGANSVSVAWV